MNLLKLKETLYQLCQNDLDIRLEVVHNKIKDTQSALQVETKSSAGDKHETGRAMIQLEREKLGIQLAQLQQQQEILSKINYKDYHKMIGLGSLVLTNKANYFIAISAGEFVINNLKVYAISSQTPMAQILFGATTGTTLKFRSEEIKITEVY